MPQKREKLVAVIGGNEPSPEEARLAEEVGRELARRGAILLCGGLGGIMEAACRGAASEGGITIGILPGNSPKDANPYVRIPIVSGTGYARNIAVVKSAQAVIAIGGSYGTLSEIAYARQSDIPVIGLNTWSISRNGQMDDSIIVAEDPVSAVNIALSSEE
ncbi:MAG TPA: TIGR00725 family protein [Dehalococcoidia bacterium]|nr:TIGR00725 family protein [Dehalococcoidia bacterium]